MTATRRIVLGLPALLASLCMATGTPVRSQESCRNQLTEMEQDIQGRLGAKILSIDKIINNSSPFGDAKYELRIRLGSTLNTGVTASQSGAGENIINSPSLMNDYSQRIISTCSEMAGVIFSYYEYNEGWVLLPGGQLQEIKCGDPNRDNYYAWGEIGCL